MSITKHASTRMQQRGIPLLVVELIMTFGASEPAGSGTQKFFLDKRARHKVKSFAGTLASAIEPLLDAYVLVSDQGTVITTAHRTERIHRH